MSKKSLKTCFVSTDGCGLWSREKRKVKLINMCVEYASGDFGNLCVFFDKKTWDTHEHGLIYTDKGWLDGFRNKLVTKNGYSEKAAKDIDYSEQGMQGDDFVSLDCGAVFLAEYYAAKAKAAK